MERQLKAILGTTKNSSDLDDTSYADEYTMHGFTSTKTYQEMREIICHSSGNIRETIGKQSETSDEQQKSNHH